MATSPVASAPSLSPSMQHLLNQQKYVKNLLAEVEQKILTLENTYLIETTLGNVVRGWDVDAKPVVGRPRLADDKEKLFSQSSYNTWLEYKLHSEINEEKRKFDSSGNNNALGTLPLRKKLKKSKSTNKLVEEEDVE